MAVKPVLIALLLGILIPAPAQKGLLKDVNKIRVDQTVITQESKVKEDFAVELVKNSLRNALTSSAIEVVADAPLRAQIELREFSSGNQATRILVGFGAGRATINADLVIRDSDGKQLARKQIKTKGELFGSGYQVSSTQRTHAFTAFELRLAEEIARLR